jgi:hypothetical protein
VDELE